MALERHRVQHTPRTPSKLYLTFSMGGRWCLSIHRRRYCRCVARGGGRSVSRVTAPRQTRETGIARFWSPTRTCRRDTAPPEVLPRARASRVEGGVPKHDTLEETKYEILDIYIYIYIDQKSSRRRVFVHSHYENENAKIVLNFLDFSTILAC